MTMQDRSRQEAIRALSKADLARGMDRDELTIVYQPQVTADGQMVASVEALVRWDHPRLGRIMPSEFIAMAERTGLIDQVGLYVLQKACRETLSWTGLRIAVNISPTHFAKDTFVDDVARVLAATWFPASRLEIEIVESAAFDNQDRAKEQIDRIHQFGAQVSLDDFGTGYSSLSMLQRLPFDKVKIDKSFVDGIPATRSVAILHAIIALVRALGMKVTAEGIETEEQRRFLKAAGCHFLQGYLFSRPIEASVMPDFLAKMRPGPR